MTKYIQLGWRTGDPAAINDYGLLYIDDATGDFKIRRPSNAASDPGGIINLGNPLSNPMTAIDDIVKGGPGGTPQRLAIGAVGQVLGVNPGGNLSYINSAGFMPGRAIFVAKSGGDHTTLAAAIAAAALLTPTVANPVQIIMYPGTYSENDFTLLAGVHVFGFCRESVIIDAVDTAGTLCTIKKDASLCGVTIQGASGGGGVGVQFDSGSSPGGMIDNCVVNDCEALIRTFGGTVARVNNSALTNSIIFDIEMTTVGDTLILNNVEGNKDKVSAVLGSELIGSAHNNREGERSFNVLAELHVGTFLHPREAVFGEGDSHILGMEVLRNTNLEAGSWSSITDALKSATGSTATLFTGNNINNAIYIGGMTPFPGVKIDVTTAIALSSGELVWEYWEGSTWVPLRVMVTKAAAPYTAYATSAFSNVQNDQIRFGDVTGWSQKSLNGLNKYWARCRIVTSPISTIPAAESLKLHTNRTEINKDGFLEYFGSARPLQTLPEVHMRLTDDLSGLSPSNENIDFSPTVNLTPIDNEFQNGAIDGFGGTFRVDERLDTSLPINVEVLWTPLGAGAGDVALSFTSTLAKVGDTMNGSLPEVTSTEIESVSGQNDELILTSFQIDAKDYVPGDLVGWALRRDATGGTSPTGDDFGANIAIMSIRATASFWR